MRQLGLRRVHWCREAFRAKLREASRPSRDAQGPRVLRRQLLRRDRAVGKIESVGHDRSVGIRDHVSVSVYVKAVAVREHISGDVVAFDLNVAAAVV